MIDRRSFRIITATAMATALLACAKKAPPPAAAVPVTVAKAEQRTVPYTLQANGTVEPMQTVAIEPQVSGIITKIFFKEGDDVKEGQPLFEIDPRAYQAAYNQAQAVVARDSAQLASATSDVARYSALVSKNYVTSQQMEQVKTTAAALQATLAADEALAQQAKLNLQYATIRAPISGIVGAALASEGTLVVQNDTASLATIQQLDPIYADFTQSVSEMSKLRRAFESGDLDRISPDSAKVRLLLDDGSVYPLPGRLLFSESKVDAYTGQVTLRGQFPNPKRELLPGMYVRVLIEQGIDTDAMAVPQQAIQRDAGGGSQVFVVKNDGRVATQTVRTGAVQDGLWLVSDGLKDGDRVVVDGFQKFVAGDKVKPKAWVDADASTGAIAAAQPLQVAR